MYKSSAARQQREYTIVGERLNPGGQALVFGAKQGKTY